MRRYLIKIIYIFVQLRFQIYYFAGVITVTVYMCVWRNDIYMMLGVKLQAVGWKEEFLICSNFEWIHQRTVQRRFIEELIYLEQQIYRTMEWLVIVVYEIYCSYINSRYKTI